MRKTRKPTPESLVVRSCIQWLYYKGIFAWRNNTGGYKTEDGSYIRYGLKGSPDIIGILPDGRFLGVECKSGKNDIKGSQIDFKNKIESMNGVYVVAWSTDDLDKALRDIISLPPKAC